MKVIKGYEAKVGDILICVENSSINTNGHEIWVKVSESSFAGLWGGCYDNLWLGCAYEFVKIDNDQKLAKQLFDDE